MVNSFCRGPVEVREDLTVRTYPDAHTALRSIMESTEATTGALSSDRTRIVTTDGYGRVRRYHVQPARTGNGSHPQGSRSFA